MDKNIRKSQKLAARKIRIRHKVRGVDGRPRLCVRRSLSQMYVQVIDDVRGRSLAQINSMSKEVAEKKAGLKGKVAVSKVLGEAIAEKLIAQGIKKVVFDRGGFPYCGRVKAVADGARAKGLEF